MKDNERIFIGVAWPYANGPQHIGHIAGVYLPADIFARYQRMAGRNVLMVSGSDTHGTPITITADKEGCSPLEVVNKNHASFIENYRKLGFTFDLFTHTDTQCHWETSQQMFLTHLKNKFLEVRTQEQLFDPITKSFLPDRYVEGNCPKCGSSKARGDQCDSCGETFHSTELVNPRSILNKDHKLEVRETDHFFFKLSEFNDALKSYLYENKEHWRPHVLNYSRGQVENVKLEDRAITRDIEWGVRVPVEGFNEKCLYVWYEAVIGYLSASKEWAKVYSNEDDWKNWWEEKYNDQVKAYYFLGKDNIVFHSLLWPSFLMAHKNLILPYDVPANQHLNSYGEKFSKSRGVIISVSSILEKYDPDFIRYALTSMAPENSDSDFTWEDFQDRINNELASNWGNLVQRALTFSYRKLNGKVPSPGTLTDRDKDLLKTIEAGFERIGDLFNKVKLKAALHELRDLSSLLNKYLNDEEPWKTIKVDEARAHTVLYVTLQAVDWLKILWYPILPNSSEKIHKMLGYETQLGGDLLEDTVKDDRGTHKVLNYSHKSARGVWTPSVLPPGQELREPSVLFPRVELSPE